MTYVSAVSVATFWTYENGCSYFLSVAHWYSDLSQDLSTMVPLLLAAMVELRCIWRFSSCFYFFIADQSIAKLCVVCATCACARVSTRHHYDM